jgi:hypothetical protein
VVSVAVNAGWGEDRGEAVEKLEGRETQGGAAGGVGLGQDVENLVRAAADEVETVESERGPRTVADQPLEAFAVGGLDADAPIQTEPASVLPGQHILGVVGFQQAMAGKVAEDSPSDGVLEALREFGGEGCGLMEAEAGFWIGGRTQIRITRDLLEEPVHDAKVAVVVRIEARAEAMQEADGPEGG